MDNIEQQQQQQEKLPGIWDYRVGVVIAEGAFGKVLYGKHKVTGKDVAIKVTDRFSCRKYPFLVRALRREQALLRQLGDCRYIVRLLSSFVDGEGVYIVLECCMGGTLEDAVRRQFNKTEDASSSSSRTTFVNVEEWSIRLAHYSHQILKGLYSIHSNGYIHADLKPSNILLTEQGEVRLADFGSALPIEGNEVVGAWRMTTTDYTSPELLRADVLKFPFPGNFDVTSLTIQRMIAMDVWSLGCLLWECLRGVSPFHAASDALAVDQIIEYAELTTTDMRKEWLLSKGTSSSVSDENWLAVVLDFLNPNPDQRLGGSRVAYVPQLDASSESRTINVVRALHSHVSKYEIWNEACLQGTDISLRPNHSPEWWLRQEKGFQMRDGATDRWDILME